MKPRIFKFQKENCFKSQRKKYNLKFKNAKIEKLAKGFASVGWRNGRSRWAAICLGGWDSKSRRNSSFYPVIGPWWMVAESFRSFVTDRERGLSIRSRIYPGLDSKIREKKTQGNDYHRWWLGRNAGSIPRFSNYSRINDPFRS